MKITRQKIISALKNGLKREPFVLALWLEGSEASGRVDRYSDLDVCLDVKDGYEENAVRRVRQILLELAPLDISRERTNPHPQLRNFGYHLQGTPKTLVIDLEIQSHSRKYVFVKGLPGDAIKVLFAKKGGIKYRAFDLPAFRSRINKRITELDRYYLFICDSWVAKNIARGNYIESVYYYQTYVVEPIIELLRMKHCPLTWGELPFKHIGDDLPAGASRTVEKFYRVTSINDIKHKTQQARILFTRLLPEVQSTYCVPGRALTKRRRR
jgi:hypothetical protein